MSDDPLKVVARIKAKPDKIDEVSELLCGLIEPSFSDQSQFSKTFKRYTGWPPADFRKIPLPR